MSEPNQVTNSPLVLLMFDRMQGKSDKEVYAHAQVLAATAITQGYQVRGEAVGASQIQAGAQYLGAAYTAVTNSRGSWQNVSNYLKNHVNRLRSVADLSHNDPTIMRQAAQVGLNHVFRVQGLAPLPSEPVENVRYVLSVRGDAAAAVTARELADTVIWRAVRDFSAPTGEDDYWSRTATPVLGAAYLEAAQEGLSTADVRSFISLEAVDPKLAGIVADVIDSALTNARRVVRTQFAVLGPVEEVRRQLDTTPEQVARMHAHQFALEDVEVTDPSSVTAGDYWTTAAASVLTAAYYQVATTGGDSADVRRLIDSGTATDSIPGYDAHSQMGEAIRATALQGLKLGVSDRLAELRTDLRTSSVERASWTASVFARAAVDGVPRADKSKAAVVIAAAYFAAASEGGSLSNARDFVEGDLSALTEALDPESPLAHDLAGIADGLSLDDLRTATEALNRVEYMMQVQPEQVLQL